MSETLTRREAATGLALIGALGAGPALALDADDVDRAQRALFRRDQGAWRKALDDLSARGNPDAAAAIILAMRFTAYPDAPMSATLTRLTGATEPDDWFSWMMWQEANPQIVPNDAFVRLQRDMFLSIDRNFEVFLKPEYLRRNAMRIRFEEIAWGGVRKDGIPSLDGPRMISAAEADYLRDDDLVFGISINGDVRAYPLRIMGWHEMFNDVIGGVPVALAYCTLCGAAILFETDVPGRGKPLVFGSSGFLYRSNKLMFDRETHSLWNQFTGQPVVGPLVGSGIELSQRPVVTETWGAWRRRNPGTTVLSLDTGFLRDYGSGVVYKEYFASDDLMFPALSDTSLLSQKERVFGIRTFGAAKAWAVEGFEGGRVLNDGVGDLALVLIGDAAGRSVRAYDRGDLRFEEGAGGSLAAGGTTWTIGEEALTSADGRSAPRVAGHLAYWFAWNGYLGAESELWRP